MVACHLQLPALVEAPLGATECRMSGARVEVRRRDARGTGIKPVLYLVGLVLVTTAAMMLLPMLVDLSFGNRDWQAFAIAAAIAAVGGCGLVAACRGSLNAGFTLRQAFLLTPLSWFSVAAVSALPFFFSDYGTVSGSLPDAVFEAVSGITTTGATVIVGFNDAPPGLLLRRALLRMGGWHHRRASPSCQRSVLAAAPSAESRIGPKNHAACRSARRSVRSIGVALAAVVYWLVGMPVRRHCTLTSIATGGYSTSDSSFGAWEANGIQWFGAVFMLAGSIPFVLYVRAVAGEARALWDRQIKTFLALLVVVIVLLGLWLTLSGQYAIEPAFRHAAFNVVSVVTTTGFATTDYTLWGNAIVGVFFGLTFIGGCTVRRPAGSRSSVSRCWPSCCRPTSSACFILAASSRGRMVIGCSMTTWSDRWWRSSRCSFCATRR